METTPILDTARTAPMRQYKTPEPGAGEAFVAILCMPETISATSEHAVAAPMAPAPDQNAEEVIGADSDTTDPAHDDGVAVASVAPVIIVGATGSPALSGTDQVLDTPEKKAVSDFGGVAPPTAAGKGGKVAADVAASGAAPDAAPRIKEPILSGAITPPVDTAIIAAPVVANGPNGTENAPTATGAGLPSENNRVSSTATTERPASTSDITHLPQADPKELQDVALSAPAPSEAGRTLPTTVPGSPETSARPTTPETARSEAATGSAERDSRSLQAERPVPDPASLQQVSYRVRALSQMPGAGMAGLTAFNADGPVPPPPTVQPIMGNSRGIVEAPQRDPVPVPAAVSAVAVSAPRPEHRSAEPAQMDASPDRTSPAIPSPAWPPTPLATAWGSALSERVQLFGPNDPGGVGETLTGVLGTDSSSATRIVDKAQSLPTAFHHLPPGLVARLADAAARGHDHPIELTLSPEELGKVRMSFSTHDGALTMLLQADRPETLDLLRRHIDTLAQDFRDLGFEDLTFSFGQNSNPQQPDHPEDTAGTGGTNEGGQPDLHLGTSVISAPLQPDRNGGLDLRM